MNFTLRVWRQKNPADAGGFKEYKAADILADMSFLEMLDEVNNDLVTKNEEPIAFESDCREGICGTCCQMIDGEAHGPETATTVCQLFMRSFKDGDTIVIEPWRAKAFPIMRDLIVDRSAFDGIIAAGGFVTANVGGAQDANNILIPKPDADTAMDAAQCIGCGACVAACPNASAMLFVAAKVSHLAHLPQGKPEKAKRALAMVSKMDGSGFGNCRNHYECEAACPKEISVEHIAKMNREYGTAALFSGQNPPA
ncbi:MAG TPA: succinate dehydrogenase/fumarate reductase iron-sulfur subunit [Fibrobacteria bacterium]|nr:succinate dehydrogenase/fumarate reductase iron-sulfur subunit [Fibrobacteria bacterium]